MRWNQWPNDFRHIRRYRWPDRMQVMKRWLLALAVIVAATHGVASEQVTLVRYSDVAVFLDRQVSARVESLDESILSAEVSARVMAIEVRPGQYVESGQRLVVLDDRSFAIERDSARARLEVAEAELEMARLRAERARRLAPEKFVSEDQLLEAETRLRQAIAEVEVARQTLAASELVLERSVIEAPFSGVVTHRLISQGALASPGTPLLELVGMEAIEIVAGIVPDQVGGLRQAGQVEFVAGARQWPVALARISEVVSRGSRTMQARFEFSDAGAPPGREGRIVWTDPRPALPADYILQRDGRLGVLVLDEDGQSVAFIALPDADAGRPFPVDLPADTLLIDAGRQRVGPGATVRVQ